MEETNHADTDTHREHAKHPAAHLWGCCKIDEGCLHDAKSGIGDTRQQQDETCDRRIGRQDKDRQHKEIYCHAANEEPREMGRLGTERDHNSAAESSDPVHAGEQADAGGTESQIILAYHRYHAGERPAKSIVDYSDDHRPAHSWVAPDENEPLD